MNEAGIKYGDWTGVKFDTLTSELELDIIKKLGAYPEEIREAAEHRAPHRIARYLYELAGMFHSFYKQGRIMGVDSDLQQARLGLITRLPMYCVTASVF